MQASKVLGRITAIKALVAQQKVILEDLKDIFGRVVPDYKHPSINSNKYTRNMLRVPVLSGAAEPSENPVERTRGQMSYVGATLEKIIDGRRHFSETLQKTQATVCLSDVLQSGP